MILLYKPSTYNFIWPLEESKNVLVFNSLTTRLAEIQGDFISMLSSKQIDMTDLSIEEKKMAGEFIKDGFLIDESVDELKIIKYNSASQKYNKSVLFLTIAPTLDCNFKCTYCFQSSKPDSVMSEEVQNSIVEYVSKSVRRVDRIFITWFGGEPLLEKEIIYRLSAEINDLAKKNGTSCASFMVTNGSLFDNDSIGRLKDSGVRSFQITLDGPPRIHNKRRPLGQYGDVQDSFEIILSSIKDLIKNEMKVNIRVNLDDANIDSMEELMDALEDRGIKNINIYPAQVVPLTDACKSIENACLNKKEFAEIGSKFYEMLLRKGFKTDYSSIYPRRKTNYCGADQINSLCIGPDGLIYKCWSDFGIKENNVGKIMDLSKGKKMKANHIPWLTWDPFDFNQCRKCKVLPLCMGGCPHKGMKVNGGRPDCSEIRFNLESIVKNHYRCVKIKEYCKRAFDQASL